MIGELFRIGIKTEGGIIAHFDIGISSQQIGAESIDTGAQRREGLTDLGRLGHAVDDTATAATAEKERIGTAQDLDLFVIIERAVILHIIADTIEEEVRRGLIAANDDRVAMALALADRQARRIAQNVTEIGEALFGDLNIGDDREALRHVDDRGWGLHRVQLVQRRYWPWTVIWSSIS